VLRGVALNRQPRPSRLTQAITRRGPAIGVAVACVLRLGVAAVPLARLDLGVAFVQSLPEDDPVQVAAAAAAEGFAAGILSPTEILLEGEGLGARPEALAELGRRLDAEPGVAGVVGPRDLPVTGELGILVSQSGDAARYLVVFDTDPLGATAIDNLERLEDRPVLLETAGLTAVTGIAGDTALAQGIVDETR